jgi:hypothetical protein
MVQVVTDQRDRPVVAELLDCPHHRIGEVGRRRVRNPHTDKGRRKPERPVAPGPVSCCRTDMSNVRDQRCLKAAEGRALTDTRAAGQQTAAP